MGKDVSVPPLDGFAKALEDEALDRLVKLADGKILTVTVILSGLIQGYNGYSTRFIAEMQEDFINRIFGSAPFKFKGPDVESSTLQLRMNIKERCELPSSRTVLETDSFTPSVFSPFTLPPGCGVGDCEMSGWHRVPRCTKWVYGIEVIGVPDSWSDNPFTNVMLNLIISLTFGSPVVSLSDAILFFFSIAVLPFRGPTKLREFLRLMFLFKLSDYIPLSAPLDMGNGLENRFGNDDPSGTFDISDQLAGDHRVDTFWVSRFDKGSQFANSKTVCFVLESASQKEAILSRCSVIPLVNTDSSSMSFYEQT